MISEHARVGVDWFGSGWGVFADRYCSWIDIVRGMLCCVDPPFSWIDLAQLLILFVD